MYASNLSSEFYKDAYKQHLKVWNNFHEGSPKKRGFEEFDNAFKSIINNTVDEPVPVNQEGHIANGSHRLAAALYHQRPINIRETNSNENYEDEVYRLKFDNETNKVGIKKRVKKRL